MKITAIHNDGKHQMRAIEQDNGSVALELLKGEYVHQGMVALDADSEARLLNLLTERRDRAQLEQIRAEVRAQLVAELASGKPVTGGPAGR